jgi:hypothetical protein
LTLAVNTQKANTAIGVPPAGALVGNTSIADALWLQPLVTARITDIADSVVVPTNFSVVMHTAVEWNITARLTALVYATASTMRIFFAFEVPCNRMRTLAVALVSEWALV